MADAAPAAEGAAPTPKTPKGPMILVLLNTVAAIAALGMFVYVKLIFKRPQITESLERLKIEEAKKKKAALAGQGPAVLINFEPVTINIKATAQQLKQIEGTQAGLEGQMHYATVGFALEIRDESKKDMIEKFRPIILDKVLAIVGRKDYNELITVQGRYLLRAQIQDLTNELASAGTGQKEAFVTNVYLSQFQVQ